MNNKFAQIVKIRQQQMDKIESRLAKARFEKKQVEQKLDALYEDIASKIPPQNGIASMMLLFHENLKVLRREKDDYTNALAYMSGEVVKLQQEYKKAHMEYEKIKYLQEQEYAKWLEKIKKQEKIDMDDISTMLFSNLKGV